VGLGKTIEQAMGFGVVNGPEYELVQTPVVRQPSLSL